VENVKLLGGMAPTCSLEQLAYDCRLFNQALADGRKGALTLRRWLVNSDAALDPQAFLLNPQSTFALAEAIVGAPDHYQAGVAVAACAVGLLRKGAASGDVRIDARELPWLEQMEEAVSALPSDEGDFIERMMGEVDRTKFRPGEYDLGG
jgi:methanol--5-hydroxybenzimidazolylcobamide Co-methyltransferase